MVWFLVVIALLFAALGDYTEAVVLGLALLPIAGMDAYLHRRTQGWDRRTGRAPGVHGARPASGRRPRSIAAVDIVPGDLAIVAAGQPFPPTA